MGLDVQAPPSGTAASKPKPLKYRPDGADAHSESFGDDDLAATHHVSRAFGRSSRFLFALVRRLG